jgi:hypothetical protein
MSDELDDRLRDALRPVDPGEKFTQSVLSRVTRQSLQPQRRPLAFRWAAAAGVAAVALGALAMHQWQLRRQGLEARRQLIEALQVTGEKLDLAYRAVNDAARDEDSGA